MEMCISYKENLTGLPWLEVDDGYLTFLKRVCGDFSISLLFFLIPFFVEYEIRKIAMLIIIILKHFIFFLYLPNLIT